MSLISGKWVLGSSSSVLVAVCTFPVSFIPDYRMWGMGPPGHALSIFVDPCSAVYVQA